MIRITVNKSTLGWDLYSRLASQLYVLAVCLLTVSCFFFAITEKSYSQDSDSTFSTLEISFPYLRGSENLIRHAFDPEKNLLYILDHGGDVLLRVNPSGHIDTLMTDFLSNESEYYLFDVSQEDGTLYFWEEEVGKVFKLNLNTFDFYQIDETTVANLMRGHTAVSCPDNLIYAFGGYGIWEEKNIMLYFDESLKGWLKINHEGPRPPRSENPFMVFEHGEGVDRFHVLIPKTEQRRQFTYYQFDRYQPEWKSIVDIELPQSVSLPEHNVVATHTYRFNEEQNQFHLMNEIFFDVAEATLLKAEGQLPDDLLQTVYYYSPLREEWIRVGIVERDQFLRLHISRHQIETFVLKTLTRPPFLFRNQTILLALTLGGLASFLIFFITRKPQNVSESVPPRIVLKRNESGLQIKVDGVMMSQPDAKLSLIWDFIYRMVEEQQTSLNLADLNKALFNQEHVDAHVSRVRSKLINLLQDQLGQEFIWIERNKLDKRYKVIRINLELVEIQS